MNFDSNKWKIYTWKNWMMIHWIINPGLAINELILGQRIPKLFLEDRGSNKPRIERSFVPCPHCEMLHDSRTWSLKNGTAFKNWFGLYCTNCNGIIPCLRNSLSLLIIVITFPFWFFIKDRIRNNWLKKQPNRFENLDLDSIQNPFEGKGWLKQGLSWGFFMFIFMTFLYPLIKDEPIESRNILIGIPIWTIGGLCFGYTMKLLMGTKE
ncbi:MAG: hypothetical protein P1U56_20450 [Saprospiraceae bacterium]|nr:hypothetical protein [Saprospiraceae bacterium]